MAEIKHLGRFRPSDIDNTLIEYASYIADTLKAKKCISSII
jgi:hypothetical protein